MQKRFITIACFVFFLQNILTAQTVGPEVTNWIINNTGATGYAGIESNVQEVQYSDNNVYISCTCIPGYDIGPWTGNPNIPSNQNFVFKITRAPQQNTGTAVDVPLGHIGVWTNGVSIFNAADAMTYNNQGIWHQNAIHFEGSGFDSCLGHPNQTGEYHHHLNPRCLYNDADSTHHSPIIGYAFDGFPIYGAYGYANTDGSGGIKRVVSGYEVRNITARTTLPDGTVLTSGQYGPAINGTYPLGSYLEDYDYTGNGDLDAHNGRFCVTPEYPAGTYAYFVTIDANLDGTYPYTLGPTYYGTVQAGNTGMGSGHNTIDESVTVYTSVNEPTNEIQFSVCNIPSSNYLSFLVDPSYNANMTATLLTIDGKVVATMQNIQSAVQYAFDMSKLASGFYLLKVETGNSSVTKKVVKAF